MILFDATYYTNKPSPVLPGLKPIHVVYGGEPWPTADRTGDPPEDRIRTIARGVPAGNVFCLDIEQYTTDLWGSNPTDANIASSLQKLGRIVDLMHDERPGLRIGYYGILPTELPGSLTYRNAEVLRDNALKMGLARKVDVVFPSLYARYENAIDGWVARATATINDAKIYNKQVYPFLWPTYMEASPWKGQPIQSELWRAMLQTCLSLADGAVIWDGAKTPWNGTSSWWIETQKILEGK